MNIIINLLLVVVLSTSFYAGSNRIPPYFFGMTIVGGKVVIGGSKLPAILREF